MTQSKHEKEVELSVMLDIATITRRVLSDVKSAAHCQARKNHTSLIEELDNWITELRKDPYYLLPGDDADPRHPEPLRERDYA